MFGRCADHCSSGTSQFRDISIRFLGSSFSNEAVGPRIQNDLQINQNYSFPAILLTFESQMQNSISQVTNFHGPTQDLESLSLHSDIDNHSFHSVYR